MPDPKPRPEALHTPYRPYGSIVPIVTPCLRGDFDPESYAKHVDNLINGGVDGIFALGTAGEFQRLNLNQKQKVIDASIKAVDGRVQLLIGISASDLAEINSLARHADKPGVSGVVLMPMYGPTNHYVKFHYVKLATVLLNSSKPVVLYNNPDLHDGISIPFGFVHYATTLLRVAGIKDTSRDPEYFTRLLALGSDKFSVLQGSTGLLLQSLVAGADGIVSVAANIAPDLHHSLFQTVRNGDLEAAGDAMKQIKKLRESAKNVAAVKQSLFKQGIIASPETFGE